MKLATQAQADLFGQKMAQRMNFFIIRKRDAFFSQWIAAGFDLARQFGAKVPTGTEFLDTTATTIGMMVLMPSALNPDQYIEVLTHEAEHVHQFMVGKPEKELGLSGGLGMWWLYLSEPEMRVRYEADPCSSEMELRVARGMPLPSADEFVLPLEQGYDLHPEHVQLGRSILDIRRTSIAKGLISTPAGRNAIEVLREIDPELLDSHHR